ncbi:MAG: hypothetical protein ABFD15_06055 [Methanofastidiosum sp.]
MNNIKLTNTCNANNTKSIKTVKPTNNPCPMPLKACCNALKMAWNNDLIGMTVLNHNNKAYINYEAISTGRTIILSECIFCNKKLEPVKNLANIPRAYKRKK